LDAKQEESINSIDPDHLIIQGTGGAFLHPTHVFSGAKIPLNATDLDGKPVKVEYVCKAAYPSPDKSLLLGKYNLSRFRSRVKSLPKFYTFGSIFLRIPSLISWVLCGTSCWCGPSSLAVDASAEF